MSKLRATNKLREYRTIDAGKTMAQVAQESGLDESLISLIERRKRNLLPPTASRIAAALGMSLREAVDEGLFVLWKKSAAKPLPTKGRQRVRGR